LYSRAGRFLIIALVLFSVFSFGWGLGKGKLRLGKSISQLAKTGTLSTLDYSSVDDVYTALKDNYDGKLDNAKLLDGIKEGLAKATGDPYTEYFNVEEAKSFNEQLSGSFTGIGAELGKDKNSIVIISPISGFPADKAGLKPKDVIVEIDGKSAYDMGVEEAVKLIRGTKGTNVKLKVLRDSSHQLNFEITRDQITIPSVDSKILDNNIGYIKISRFSDDTTELTLKAAAKFKDSGVKGVVLDLRGDPGGLLDAAVSVSSIWLDDKLVVKEKRDGKVVKTYKSEGVPILKDIQTVVLIDQGSASASEITAGALRDNKAATLVGEKSYGKGSVQTLQCIGSLSFSAGTKCDSALLKVTIARWYTPADKNIDKEGLQPDVKVVLSDDDIKQANDTQLKKALSILTNN
jgi:carboxyl-terminal processing protease